VAIRLAPEGTGLLADRTGQQGKRYPRAGGTKGLRCNRGTEPENVTGRGTGPYFGQKARFVQKTKAENMDLSPYRPKGTVPRERLPEN